MPDPRLGGQASDASHRVECSAGIAETKLEPCPSLAAPSLCYFRLAGINGSQLQQATYLVAVYICASIHSASMAQEISSSEVSIERRLRNAKLCRGGAQGYQVTHGASLPAVIGIDGW